MRYPFFSSTGTRSTLSKSLLIFLLMFVAHFQVFAQVSYSSSPKTGLNALGNTIWLRLNSIDATGKASFTIGKISGTFSKNGVFHLFRDGQYRGEINYAAGSGSVDFNTAIGVEGGTFLLKVQRYDTTVTPAAYDQNVISGAIAITVTTPPPTVSGFSPNVAEVNTTPIVTVFGSNFPTSIIINIDGQREGCTRISYSPTQASFSCPLSLAGQRLFEVKNNIKDNGGTSFYDSAFIVHTGPQLSDYTPRFGMKDTETNITVTGAYFPSTTIINIADQFVGCRQTSYTPNEVKFACPLSVAGEKVLEIKTDTDKNNGKLISKQSFSVHIPNMLVTAVSPSNGTTGTNAQVSIAGQNFPSTVNVSIDAQNNPCTRTSYSSTTATFTCPLDVAGERFIRVNTDLLTNGGVTKYSAKFSVKPASPSVSSFSPSVAEVNTTPIITVIGSNFPASIIINIDGQASGCTRVSYSTTQASFSCPLSLTGQRLFEVKNNTKDNGGTSFYDSTFTVHTGPQVRDFSPRFGMKDSEANITVFGSYLPSTTIINIADQFVGCRQTAYNPNEVKFACPLSVVGEKVLEIKTDKDSNNGKVISKQIFSVQLTSMLVTSSKPINGMTGSNAQVSITGENFPSTVDVSIDAQKNPCTRTSYSTTTASFTCPLDVAGERFLRVNTDSLTKGGITKYSAKFSIYPSGVTINDVTPRTALAGTTVNVAVIGNNLPAAIAIDIDGEPTRCMRNTYSPTQATFSCPLSLDVLGSRRLKVQTDLIANGGIKFAEVLFTITAPVSIKVDSVTPLAARLDMPTNFTITGSGLTNGMAFTIEDCEPESGPGPIPEIGTGSANQRVFRCVPRLPAMKGLTVKNAPGGTELFKTQVRVDKPHRLGDAQTHGLPVVMDTSLWNGNVHLQTTDMAVPGKGVSFALTRSYNSYHSDYESNRGAVSAAAPWRFNWDLRLGYMANTGNRRLWVQREDGSGESYVKDSDNLWYPLDPGNFNQIKPETPVAGQTTLLTREGLKYIFQNPDLGGLLLKIVDHDNNGLSINRDANARVASVLDAAERSYNFSYDNNGNLQRVTDFTGRYVEYTWESSSAPAGVRLQTVRDVRGNLTRYNYNLLSSNLASNRPAPQYLLTSIVDPRGNTARSFSYTDSVYGNWGAATITDGMKFVWRLNYCAKQLDGSCGNDPALAVSFETEMLPPLGNKSIARFDTGGRLLEHLDANSNLSIIKPIDITGFGAKQFNLSALRSRTQSAKGFTTDLTYTSDNAGNLANKTDAESGVSKRIWNNNAALLAKNLYRIANYTSAAGFVHNLTFNEAGHLQSHAAPGLPAMSLSYDAAGQLDTITDRRGYTNRLEYDRFGNLTKQTDPYDFFVQNRHDDLGRVLIRTDKRKNSTKQTWDKAGNLLSATDAKSGLVSYVYDANGNRTQMTDARNNITNYTYDANNRLKTVSQINGPQVLTTTFNYDALGRISEMINANNHATSKTYDDVGNVRKQSNALSHTTQYEYDEDNRLKRSIDAEDRATEFTYDKLGRVKTVTTAVGTAAAGTSRRNYDADGRLINSTDAQGNVTEYGYDSAGRLASVLDAKKQITKMSYDENGNLLSTIDPNNHATTYTYDKLNRPLSRTDSNNQQWLMSYDENGNLKTSTVPGGKTTSYTYDALNRVERVDYPDASVVSYGYDANGNRVSMSDGTGITTYSYDALNRLLSKTDPQNKVVSYTYDGVGNVLNLTYPGGQSVTYSYDAAERLSSLQDWLGKTTAYTLNKTGQVTSALLGNNSRSDAVFDAAGRLSSLIDKSATGAVIASHALTLDKNGNINTAQTTLPLEPGLGNFERVMSYDNANRLTTFNGAAVSHDLAGRITGLAGANYSYNERDQITSISGNQTASHAYNGDGQRVLRNVNGQITRFVLDSNRKLPEVLAETDANGNVLRRYVYGYGLVEQIDSAGAASYYHYDPTGSTLALSNAAGVVTDSYAYTPYGETTSIGNTINPFRYVGKLGVMDDGNGLHYMRARYYRPDIARFMSLDALPGSGDRPQSLNRYAYVLGNPVMGVDPSGLYAKAPLIEKLDYLKAPLIEKLDYLKGPDLSFLDNKNSRIPTQEFIQKKKVPIKEIGSSAIDAVGDVGNITSFGLDIAERTMKTTLGRKIAKIMGPVADVALGGTQISIAYETQGSDKAIERFFIATGEIVGGVLARAPCLRYLATVKFAYILVPGCALGGETALGNATEWVIDVSNRPTVPIFQTAINQSNATEAMHINEFQINQANATQNLINHFKLSY